MSGHIQMDSSDSQGSKPPSPATNEAWRTYLRYIIAAQFISSLGFGFAAPFLPLFIAEVGDLSNREAALWAGIIGGVSGTIMVVAGPIWGILGDWFGYKRNVLRATFGTFAVFSLTAAVQHVLHILALRGFMGAVGGIFPAIMGLSSSLVPRARLGYVIGLLYGVVYFGNTVGPLLGGYFVNAAGYRWGFLVSGLIIGLAGLIILLGIKEAPHPKSAASRRNLGAMWTEMKGLWKIPGVRRVLFVLFLVQLANNLSIAIVPLFLNSLDADAKAPAVGIFFALLGLAITISTYGAGVLAGRLKPQVVFLLGASGAAAGALLMSFAGSVPLALGLSVVLGLGTGVLLTSSSAMIGLVSPPDRQGFAFGMVQSASALGFGIGPLLGGVFANVFGLHAPFLVQGAIFLALLPLGLIVARGRGRETGQPV